MQTMLAVANDLLLTVLVGTAVPTVLRSRRTPRRSDRLVQEDGSRLEAHPACAALRRRRDTSGIFPNMVHPRTSFPGKEHPRRR
jgi:hypothetical protein